MMQSQCYFRIVAFLLTFTLKVNSEDRNVKRDEGVVLATKVMMDFYQMFTKCVESPMPNHNFLTDNLKDFVNIPSKTTVGFAPKFTSNRKFFANMITTPAFKEMLENDENLLRRSLVNKFKYCDEAIMDQELLKNYYDRETDQSKI